MMISKISNVKFKPYFGINQRKNGENIQKDKNNNINSPQKDDTISDVILSLLLLSGKIKELLFILFKQINNCN